MQLLERQAAAHSAKLASVHGDMTRFKDSHQAVCRQLADVQWALLALEGECNESHCCFGIEEQRCDDLEALLCALSSDLVNHCL